DSSTAWHRRACYPSVPDTERSQHAVALAPETRPAHGASRRQRSIASFRTHAPMNMPEIAWRVKIKYEAAKSKVSKARPFGKLRVRLWGTEVGRDWKIIDSRFVFGPK